MDEVADTAGVSVKEGMRLISVVAPGRNANSVGDVTGDADGEAVRHIGFGANDAENDEAGRRVVIGEVGDASWMVLLVL